MVFELLGLNLEDLFRYYGNRFSMKTTLMLVDQLLRRVESLHATGHHHRDIKPENVILTNERSAKVADFGIARVLKTTLSSGFIAGTPAYMAPEAFDGERSVQTDLWSVGVIFYQLLAGRLPFPNTDRNLRIAPDVLNPGGGFARLGEQIKTVAAHHKPNLDLARETGATADRR